MSVCLSVGRSRSEFTSSGNGFFPVLVFEDRISSLDISYRYLRYTIVQAPAKSTSLIPPKINRNPRLQRLAGQDSSFHILTPPPSLPSCPASSPPAPTTPSTPPNPSHSPPSNHPHSAHPPPPPPTPPTADSAAQSAKTAAPNTSPSVPVYARHGAGPGAWQAALA